MANEFKIKNGLVSDGNIVVTGSITATGGINISGSIASSETASFAPSYTLSSSFNSYTSSASSSVGSLSSSVATTTSELSSSIGSLSGSVATTTSGLASRIGSVETKTGSYATTGSNIFVGSQVITGSICSTGDIVTTGQIVAQTINVQQVTSSIVYSCGSNIFGNILSNTQQFTGSILATGSLTIAGPLSATTIYGSTAVCSTVGKFSTCIDAGSGTFSGDLFVVKSGNALLRVHSSTNTTPTADIELMRGTNTTWGTDGYGDYRFRNCAGDLTIQYGDTGVINTRLTVSSTGNVGIGTITNLAILTSANTGALTLDSNDGNHTGFGLYVQAPSTTNTISSAIGFGVAARKLAAIAMQSYADADQVGLNFYVQPTSTGSAASLTEAMRITNCGNVGIGSCTPSDLLHIEKSQAGGMGMIIRNTCGATSNTSMCSLISLQLVGVGQTGQLGVNLIAGKEGDYSSAGVRNAFFAIQTACGDNLYERLRITSAGNIGIKTTTPVCTNLNGSMTIVKSYNGDTPTSTTAQTYDINQSNLYLFGRNAGITMIGNQNEESVIAFGNPYAYYIGGIRMGMGSGVAGGDMVFQTCGNCERIRISSAGAATFSSSITNSGNLITYKSGGGGNPKQVVVGQTTAAASGTAKKIAYVGYSHSVRVYVWANQNASNGSSAIADFTTLYGASTGGTTSEANFGNVSDIVVAYDNGGSPAYTINVTLVYTGTAPTINYIVEGINNDNSIYAI